jgi:hypothetical protein
VTGATDSRPRRASIGLTFAADDRLENARFGEPQRRDSCSCGWFKFESNELPSIAVQRDEEVSEEQWCLQDESLR